jgi:hypothetical protein
LQQTTSGISLTFVKYCSLLINTATGYDNRDDKPNSAGKSRLAVHNSETHFGDYFGSNNDEADGVDFEYNVDTTPTELHVYAANRRDRSQSDSDETRRERPKFPPGSRMPIDRWKSISDAAKTTWDTLTDEDKARILALQGQRHDPSHSKIAANIHDATHDVSPNSVDDLLIAMVTKHSNRKLPTTHPGDVRMVLSQAAKVPKVQVQDQELSINGDTYRKVNGDTYRKVNFHEVRYNVSRASHREQSSLIDRGANGGIAGSDTRVIELHPHRTVVIRGIDNHEINSLPIVTAGAVARSQRGDVILIMHQYAYHPQQGRSIHSACQLESFANDVNDKSIHILGGKQRIKTVDGYVFHLSIRDGLPYLGMRPYTDGEYDSLPHVILSSNVDWNPRILDFDFEETALVEEIKTAPLDGEKRRQLSHITKSVRGDVEEADDQVKQRICFDTGDLVGRNNSWDVQVVTTHGEPKMTRVHLMYAGTHDGRHKARFRSLLRQGDTTTGLLMNESSTSPNTILSGSLGSDNSPRSCRT